MKKTVVQKHGGSSLATPEQIRKVAQFIKKTARYKNIVVVVSAMGKTTDTLKALAKDVCNNEPPTPNELNKLLATGENQSAPLLAMALCNIGTKAVSLSGEQIGLVTGPGPENARIKQIKNLGRIKELLNNKKVAVVAGFQGIIEGTDQVVTLGQGGSDLTAIALAGGLGADCEIYKDVDGVHAIDPRIVPQAKRITEISYSQLIQLARAGAKILMPRAVILAQNLGLNFKVLLGPSFGKSQGGTLISSGSKLKNMEEALKEEYGVAIRTDLTLIKVSEIINEPGMASGIFDKLSTISVLNSVQGGGQTSAEISILCYSEDTVVALSRLKKMEGLKIETITNVVGLTLIRPLTQNNQPNYLSRACKAMAKVQVNIEMFSASGISILLVIKKSDLQATAGALAEEFHLFQREI